MRRPWQIWLVFALCLAVVLPALAWLTFQTLAADKAEFQARVAAEREEAIGNILWQMDTELTTLLAQEAARPYFVYSPFYAAPTVVTANERATEPGGKSLAPATKPPLDDSATAALPVQPQLPSPLLNPPSPYVVLHFQIDCHNTITSPQAPSDRQLALDNGASAENIDRSTRHLASLHGSLEYDKLLAVLPSDHIAEIAVGQWQVNSSVLQLAQNEGQVVNNTLDLPPVQQQIEEENEAYGQQQQSINPAPGQLPGDAYVFNNPRAQSRAGNDLQQRNRAYQTAAQRQVVEQRLNYSNVTPTLKYVSEGVSQTVWLDGRLLLARRVKIADEDVIQGCWLDWDKLRDELVARHTENVPGIALEPVRRDAGRDQIKVSRLLATLPAQLVVPEFPALERPWSPLRTALVVAWSMLALATVAVAMLLQGVITLSERRGAFVSAVTHELRTPLTTFRMYAEMLAENMVPNPETRQRYLDTLRIEADRLSHLVENVLAYARLERGRHGQRREATSLAHIVEHAERRFAERAAGAEMELVIEPPPPEMDDRLATDPAAVEQILFNLIDNACKYAATATDRRIHVARSLEGKYAVLRVSDHGPGIDAVAARRLFRPFSKSVHDAACSAPGVGLGLALSRRLAQQLGGRLELERSLAGAVFALYLPR